MAEPMRTNDAVWRGAVVAWLRPLLPVIIALSVLQVLAHGHLLSALIFTDHTIPNLWYWQVPSYRTWVEGRWGADLIYLLQGGRGIPLMLMMLAMPLQVLNGLLFARLLDVDSRSVVFLLAALVSLHPFFVDYFAFGGDHLVLVLGDTFILLGFVLGVAAVRARIEGRPMGACLEATNPSVSSSRPTGFGLDGSEGSGGSAGAGASRTANGYATVQMLGVVLIAATMIHLGISTYQPKIGLVATLSVVLALHQVVRWSGTMDDGVARIGVVAGAGVSVVVAVISYWASFVILVGEPVSSQGQGEVDHQTARTALLEWSALPERMARLAIEGQELFVLPEVSLFLFSNSVPLPWLLAAMFIALLLWRIWRVAHSRLAAALVAVLSVALFVALPLAVFMPYWVSAFAYPAWRFWIAAPYVLGFWLASILWLLASLRSTSEGVGGEVAARSDARAEWGMDHSRMAHWRHWITQGRALLTQLASVLVAALAVFAIYRFVLINAEIGQAAQLRTAYETAMVSTLARDIDQELREAGLEAEPRAVVVVGERSMPDQRFLRTKSVRSHLVFPMFVDYRSAEWLNFYMGRDALRSPTMEERAAGEAAAVGAPAWPASGGIRLLPSGVVVVVLE
ncbi:MAG: glucosyltransferase domain-containing protein [Thioalkalivibrionaceae bacterium]